MTLTHLNAIRERAEQARKLVEAATPGPWEYVDKLGTPGILGPPMGIRKRNDLRHSVVTIEPDGACGDPDCCPQGDHLEISKQDAAFIAASPTLVRELLDTQERLIAALELAVEQRNTMYGDPPAYPEIVEPERSAFDAALAAILEPKVNP